LADRNKTRHASGGIAGQLHLNEGGRAGFKEGSGMKRRTFLKILGGLGALPIVGKYFKFAKPLAKAKSLTSVPITQTANMPDWFIPLVNKVIKEGDNVTGKFAIKGQNEIVHQASIEGKLGKDALGVEDVRVTQKLDEGNITVEYNTPDSMAEDGVTLIYKKGKTIPNEKGIVKTKDEFTAVESYPEAHGVGPEDVEITFEGTNDALKVDDLFSDTSKLKQFATGKKLTKQELKIAKEKTDKVAKINERPEDVLPDYDWDDVVDPSDYAHGGIAGQLHLNEGGRVPFWKGGAWKAIKEAIQANKTWGVGGPPYNPGKTSFNVKDLTKRLYGEGFSLADIKKMSEAPFASGINKFNFPEFSKGWKDLKAKVIKEKLNESKLQAESMIEAATKVPADNPTAKKVQAQFLRSGKKQLEEANAGLKEIDIYIDMVAKKGRKLHAAGGITRVGYRFGSRGPGAQVQERENRRDMIEGLKKWSIDEAIKKAPEGVLTPPPDRSQLEMLKDAMTPKKGSPDYRGTVLEAVEYDDGTIYYPDTGEFYLDDGTQVEGPLEGAKPIPKTLEAAGGGIARTGYFAGLIAKGGAKLGKFTKSEVLIKMMEKTLKGSKDPYVKKNFPTFIKEMIKKPELANNPKVWSFFTKGLPKN
ncbi:MAG: hypothetical protein QGG87_04240, partial [Nitrospinota bacterium]|nr:hypothetical protein [Nitrospinota bacterium]